MASTQDDSFREIQLSGKALVFLFMAVIVIAVGIFLMGLQVGRGVLAARGAPGADATAATETEPPPPPAAASTGSSTSPATAGEKLSYAERLGSPEPAKEQLKAVVPPAPPEAPPTPRAETSASASPAGAPAVGTKPATDAPAARAIPPEPSVARFEIHVTPLREPERALLLVVTGCVGVRQVAARDLRPGPAVGDERPQVVLHFGFLTRARMKVGNLQDAYGRHRAGTL